MTVWMLHNIPQNALYCLAHKVLVSPHSPSLKLSLPSAPSSLHWAIWPGGLLEGTFTALCWMLHNSGRKVAWFPAVAKHLELTFKSFYHNFSFWSEQQRRGSCLHAFCLELPQKIRFWLNFGKNGKLLALKRNKRTGFENMLPPQGHNLHFIWP